MKVFNAKKTYGDCEGPFGFPMRSDMAKAIDEIMKGLPKECKDVGYLRVFKAASNQDFVEGERADISVITCGSVDRDSEVLFPAGGDWNQFKRNAVVTFCHQYDQLPVGRCLWVKRSKEENMDGWIAKSTYFTKPDGWEGPWMPDAVWHMIKNQGLKGKSIGFIPAEVRSPNPDEIRKYPELSKVRRVFPKWIAIEYAVCPVQSNPDATVQAVAKCVKDGVTVPKSLIESSGLIIPEFDQVFFDDTNPQDPGVKTVDPAEFEAMVTKSIKRVNPGDLVQQEIDKLNIPELVKSTIELMSGKV